jgi:hypothetical protein
MNTKHIDAIANAVLYEGYMLYPYRPSSVKNRQRFNFGVLYQKAYSEAQSGSDAWNMQTECLVKTTSLTHTSLTNTSLTEIEIRVRFLKLVDRSVRKLSKVEPGSALSSASAYEVVSGLEVGDKTFAPWQEAIECEVTVPACNLERLTSAPIDWTFAFPAKEEIELLRDATGRLAGQIVRRQEPVCGAVEIRAARVGEGVSKLTVRVKNVTPSVMTPVMTSEDAAREMGRDSSLMRSLVSVHVLLGVIAGEFVSLLEPPESFSELAKNCQNIRAWPVLVGVEGERDTMLASPIILYDYPQIAPESPGDLFDGTEIDEILALRVMTMTDDEKNEMRNTDERARKILERTESMPMEQLMKLHGTLRELRPSGLSAEEEMP